MLCSWGSNKHMSSPQPSSHCTLRYPLSQIRRRPSRRAWASAMSVLPPCSIPAKPCSHFPFSSPRTPTRPMFSSPSLKLPSILNSTKPMWGGNQRLLSSPRSHNNIFKSWNKHLKCFFKLKMVFLKKKSEIRAFQMLNIILPNQMDVWWGWNRANHCVDFFESIVDKEPGGVHNWSVMGRQDGKSYRYLVNK